MLSGQRLKTLRNGRNITVREVEQASRRIADVKGDKRFCISNGWLAQLENGASEPSICKLFSLSVIYRTNFLELVGLYNVDVDSKEKYESVADPFLTQLISRDAETPHQPQEQVTTGLAAMTANRIAGADECAPHIIYGHLGLADFTMYPMIRPSALLKIDTSQNKVLSGIWRNEYERPIYFLELRDAYACGWCELQGNQLLLIPHHSSPASVRRFTYLREAEVVGRVVGYSTTCEELERQSAKVPKSRAGRTSL